MLKSNQIQNLDVNFNYCNEQDKFNDTNFLKIEMIYYKFQIRLEPDPMVRHLDMIEAVAMVILQQIKSKQVGQPLYPPRTAA